MGTSRCVSLQILYTVQHACTWARLSGRSSPHTYDSSTDRQNMQRQGPAGIRFFLCFSRPQSCSAPGASCQIGTANKLPALCLQSLP